MTDINCSQSPANPTAKKRLYYFARVAGRGLEGKTNMTDRTLLVNITRGDAGIEINGKSFNLTTANIVLMPPRCNIHIITCSKDFEAEIVGFTMALQGGLMQKLGHGFFAYIFKTMVWKLSENGKKILNAYCTLYEAHCKMPNDIFSVDISTSLFNIFMLSFYQNVKDRFEENNKVTINSKSIAARFAFLLYENYKQQHSVAFYADKLCVTSKYLTHTFKSNTGITPKTAIDRTIGMEALFMLSNSSLNIQEISIQLGFPDQSYFGRFFKRLFGISPLSYRINPDLQLLERLRNEDMQMAKRIKNEE